MVVVTCFGFIVSGKDVDTLDMADEIGLVLANVLDPDPS